MRLPTKPFKMRVPTSLLVVIILMAHAACMGARARPDVTGTWKMNSSKSHFDSFRPTSMTIIFVQRGSSLLETLTVDSDGEEHSAELKYTTDRKESVNQIGDKSAKTIAALEKDALVIEWEGDGGYLRRKITLSEDGMTMTMAWHQSDEISLEFDNTVVLEKQ